MHKTFLQHLLDFKKINPSTCARLLRWSPQRISYLIGKDCAGFPFKDLWHLKKSLELSDKDLLYILSQYFADKKND